VAGRVKEYDEGRQMVIHNRMMAKRVGEVLEEKKMKLGKNFEGKSACYLKLHF
jgi:hypothetical protein